MAPAGSVFPQVQATGTGGLTGVFSLLVTSVTSSPATGTTITVTLKGGPPTEDLPFVWRLL